MNKDKIPVGWVYKIIVNKHSSGSPLEGQIQIGGVWGDPSNHLHFSPEQPIDKWVWWESAVYLEKDINE